MRRLTLPEYQVRAFEPVPRAVAEALAGTGAVKVSADLDGRTVLHASSRVGVVRVGDIELRVTPKVGIRRLLWLIGHAHNPSGWREDDIVELAVTDDLVTALAVSLHAAAKRALAHGVLRGYASVETTLPGLRGRLREADQLRFRHGLGMPLEVRYDDYTVDIPENQILLTAIRRLLRMPALPPSTLVGLRRLHAVLGDVTALAPGQPVPATHPTRLSRHYQSALRLATLVLAGQSFDQAPGSVAATGFLFDLNQVFESWLAVSLRQALENDDGHLHSQSPSHLDTDQMVRIRPDLVWTRDGRPAAALDAKYKPTTEQPQHERDLYQMLAYCTALGTSSGHLIYASGPPRRTYTVRRAGTEINVWALDLKQSPDRIRQQIVRIATTVTAKS